MLSILLVIDKCGLFHLNCYDFTFHWLLELFHRNVVGIVIHIGLIQIARVGIGIVIYSRLARIVRRVGEELYVVLLVNGCSSCYLYIRLTLVTRKTGVINVMFTNQELIDIMLTVFFIN